MPSFAFGDDSPSTLALTETERGGKTLQAGTVKLTVRNTTDRPVTGQISIQPADTPAAQWISFEGAPPTAPNFLVVDFARGAAQTLALTVAAPPDAPPGQQVFRVRVAREDMTDTDYAESPAIAFEVAPPKPAATPQPVKKSFPWWAVAAAVVLVLGGGLAAYWLWPDDRVEVPVVENTSLDVAVQRIADAGLGYKVLPDTTRVANRADLWVNRSDPKAGASVGTDRPVTLFLNPPAPPQGGGTRPPVVFRCPPLCVNEVIRNDEVRRRLTTDQDFRGAIRDPRSVLREGTR